MTKLDPSLACARVVPSTFAAAPCSRSPNAPSMARFIGLNCACRSPSRAPMVVVARREVRITPNPPNRRRDRAMRSNRIDRDTATRRRRRACDDSRGHGRGRTRREPGRACASETHATPRREATGDDGWRRTKGGARGRRRATTERAARDERGARTGRATRKRER